MKESGWQRGGKQNQKTEPKQKKTSRVKAQEQQWSDLLVEQARKRNGYDQQNGRSVEVKLKGTDGRIRPVSTEAWDSV